MFRPTAFKLIFSCVLGGVFFLVAANENLRLFPCEMTASQTSADSQAEDTPKTTEQICTLLELNRPKEAGDTAELTGLGYVVCAFSFSAIPLLMGFGFGHLIEKNKQQA